MVFYSRIEMPPDKTKQKKNSSKKHILKKMVIYFIQLIWPRIDRNIQASWIAQFFILSSVSILWQINDGWFRLVCFIVSVLFWKYFSVVFVSKMNIIVECCWVIQFVMCTASYSIGIKPKINIHDHDAHFFFFFESHYESATITLADTGSQDGHRRIIISTCFYFT